jgi:hypothetical protein
MKTMAMTKNSSCPECGDSLSSYARRCPCGWFKAGQAIQEPSDHRCKYTLGTRRCPLPGTICSSPYAGSPWCCSEHWRTWDDPVRGKEALLNAEENYQQILEQKRDWRKKLHNN